MYIFNLMPSSFLYVLLVALLCALAAAMFFAQRIRFVKFVTTFVGDRFGSMAPQAFAVSTFVAGAILLFSGATPARAGRMGWVNNVLPLPIVEASAYFASVAGVGLIILARGLQQRLDAAYHLTVMLLVGSVVFALTSAFDVEQSIVLLIMLILMLSSERFFYRKASILEERFSAGWIAAILSVFIGSVMIAYSHYGARGLGADVFWRFADDAQGPRAQRSLLLAAITLGAFGVARLLRPARKKPVRPSTDDLQLAQSIVASSSRASAQLVFLGDKSIMFDAERKAFLMYGVAGKSWVALGDPIGDKEHCVALIERFITECDKHGGWPVFYRVTPAYLHLYLDYALAVVKLGEAATVPLADFSLDGAKRRNLRRVWRKLVDDGCTFTLVPSGDVEHLIPELRRVSDEWLESKRAREKRFSLGRFAPEFLKHSAIGIVKQNGRLLAFVSLWESGDRYEVEVDLMRHVADAPPGVMRYALMESMLWARAQGYSRFNLGAAPLSGIRSSAVSPVWNQVSLAVRGVGEKYYNFAGLRSFKDWFYPEWEARYLVSPGGAKRPLIIANISTLISGSVGGVLRR